MHPTTPITSDPEINKSMDNISNDASTQSIPDLASSNRATSSFIQDSATVLAMKAQIEMMQRICYKCNKT